jgi:hypothetical protein
MSDHHENSDDTDVSRRTFMKASGVAVGASALGVGAAGAASVADGELDERFLNWRTVEAQKVWDRGYRGRPDRAVGINETGSDTRHPELGPWNGVLIEKDGKGINLKEVRTEARELPALEEVGAGTETFVGTGRQFFYEATRTFTLDEPRYVGADTTEQASGSFDGSVSGGSPPPAAAPGSGSVIYTTDQFSFEPADAGSDEEVVGYRVDATLTWDQPGPDQAADLELRLQKGGSDIATSGGTWEPESTEERLSATQGVAPDATYNFVVESAGGAATEWSVEYTVQALTQPSGFEPVELLDPGYRVDATLTWNEEVTGDNPTDSEPAKVEVELRDSDGNAVANAGNAFIDTFYDDNELTLSAEVPPDVYTFRVTTWRGVTDWELKADLTRLEASDRIEERDVTVTSSFDGDPIPDVSEPGADTPKTIGWYNTGRYLDSDRPRDPNGHGTHVSSIAAGSGRASTIDFRNTTVEEPRAVLLPGDFVEYEVEAEAGTTVFASAFGEGVQVDIVNPDGEVVHEAPLRGDSVIADQPVLDGGTYTIRARPYETESSTDAAERAQEGNPAAGRLNRIAFGTYRHPPDTAGARVPTDEPRAVHPGMAPNASIVTLEGYLQPSADFNEIADDLTETFNVRTMNHSWGFPYGVPWGQFGGAGGPVWDTVVDVLLNGGPSTERILEGIEKATEEGILNVAAAGNSFTPANGNGLPAVAEEAVSVVATGPFDGITSYSSGGVGGTDTDQEDFHAKPDVTAPGGDVKPDVATLLAGVSAPSRIELVRAAMAPESGYDDGGELGDPPRDHVSVAGTSMASPYTCGVSTLIAQAMEEDAPDTIALPEPAATGFDDAMRLKQVLLATASETVFTAAPYHTAKNVASAPQYTHGERDPYEGYGRVNPDAAVDAVSRNLLGTDPSLGDDTYETTYEESVGTYVPEDSRAVAGYVKVPGGDLAVSVDFTDYTGGNRGMAKGASHLDLFVYDAETPAENGEPNIVTSARGEQGAASVSVSVDRGDRDDPTERTFFVVAKIVNIPGVVNGFDVRANFEFAVSFDPADEFPPTAVDLNAQGGRSDDGDVFTAGQTNRVEVTIENFNTELTDEVRLLDSSPWTVDTAYGDAESYDPETGEVDLGTVTASDLPVTRAYFAEAPDTTGRYGFGPARAKAVDPADFSDDPDRTQGSTEEDISGTDVNTVVGADTEVN